MGYHIDLSSITLDEYKEKIRNKTLIPSRLILKEKIDERFSTLKKIGIKNVLDLQKQLKNKEKFKAIIKLGNINEEYLIILLREVISIQPKPFKLNEYLGINTEIIKKLEMNNIKTSVQLYVKVIDKKNRKKIIEELGIKEKEIMELIKLVDLTRIQWVNTTFAKVLFESGYDTIKKIQKADYEELYKKIKEINGEKKLYKGNIGLNDMKILVEVAKEIVQEIEY